MNIACKPLCRNVHQRDYSTKWGMKFQQSHSSGQSSLKRQKQLNLEGVTLKNG